MIRYIKIYVPYTFIMVSLNIYINCVLVYMIEFKIIFYIHGWYSVYMSVCVKNKKDFFSTNYTHLFRLYTVYN